jgi:hypothetical protein
VLMELRQYWSIQETTDYVLKTTSLRLLILFGIRKNYSSSRRNLLLCLYIKRVIKLTLVFIEC